MLARALVLSTLVTLGAAACTQPTRVADARCARAETVADTVLAYPDGLACLGSGAGHVIVANVPCGALVGPADKRAEDDACVRTSHTGRIIPLSSWDRTIDPGYSPVDG